MSNTQVNYWWGIKQQNNPCYNIPPLFQGRCPKGGGVNAPLPQADARASRWHLPLSPLRGLGAYELCEQAGFYKQDEEENKPITITEKASLWYDAKGNTAFINYTFAKDETGVIQIYDLLGQPIAKQDLPANNQLSLVALPYISSGGYFYQIKAAQGYSHIGKFVVTH